jgi:membrane protein required for colicin V production
MGVWNWLDWMLAAILVVSVIAAILKGFVRELIALAALVGGVAIAAVGYRRAAVWFEDLAKSHEIALGLGFLSLFLGTVILGALAGVLAQKLIKKADLQWFDRFLGGIFGLVRGVAVDCVILLALVAFSIKPAAVNESSLAPYVTMGTRVIARVLPLGLRERFREGFQEFRNALAARDKEKLGKQP